MSSRVIPLPTLADEVTTVPGPHGDSTVRRRRVESASAGLPPAPRTIEETGLAPTMLAELALKAMHAHGITHLAQIAAHLKLGAALVESILTPLRREGLVEVRRRGDLDGDVAYDLTGAGRQRAAEALARNFYSGAAPVSLGAYTARVAAQSVAHMGVTQPQLEARFDDLVIDEAVRERLGAAMNSRRSIMLYGPAGAGKTFLCEQLARLLSGHVAVPHAVEAAGEIVRVFDPLTHRPVKVQDTPAQRLDARSRRDARWVLCERPFVMTGGELTLEMLDLVYDPRSGHYQAPPHFKANNGIFLIDDLGRQIVTPRQLLNRWILPMEHHHDYLMLRNGAKVQVPFDTLLLFSTNLPPSQVADEAFLRRIGHKIFVGEVTVDQYRRITLAACSERAIDFSESAFGELLDLHHAHGRERLACYPRDLIRSVADAATYRGERAAMSRASLQCAWHDYFATDDTRFRRGA